MPPCSNFIIRQVALTLSLQPQPLARRARVGGRGGGEAPSRGPRRRTPGRWVSRGSNEGSLGLGVPRAGTKAPLVWCPEAEGLGRVHGLKALAGGCNGGGKPPCQDARLGACAVLHAHILRTVSTVMFAVLRWVP